MIFGRCGLGDDEYAIGSGSDSGYSGGGYSSVYDEIGSDANTLTNVYNTPNVSAPVPVESSIPSTITTGQAAPNYTDITGTWVDANTPAGAAAVAAYTAANTGASTNPALDAQNQAVINAMDNSPAVAAASQSLTSANAALAALTAAGGTAAQIAVAKQNAANAQAAYLAATAAVAKGVACTSTIVSGMCNSTLYMVAAVCGLLLMVGLMSGNAPPARR